MLRAPGTSRVDDLVERAARIRLLVSDVDGVLTAGEIVNDAEGRPLKFFDVKDGLGLWLLGQAGIRRALLTGKTSRAVEDRARELSLESCRQGVLDKAPAIEELLQEFGVTPAELCCIGDDLNDLPGLARAGLACCPADAVPDVRERVHYICAAPGGRGAVRELCELLLTAQGRWEAILQFWATGSLPDLTA